MLFFSRGISLIWNAPDGRLSCVRDSLERADDSQKVVSERCVVVGRRGAQCTLTENKAEGAARLAQGGCTFPHFKKRDRRKRDLFTNVMKSLMTAIEMELDLYLEETGDAQKTF